MNANYSMFVICVEGIIYLLHNLHSCAFNKNFAQFNSVPVNPSSLFSIFYCSLCCHVMSYHTSLKDLTFFIVINLLATVLVRCC